VIRAETPQGKPAEGDTAPCRLCGAPAHFWARKRLLNQYDVRYYRCSNCGSLETEQPYWLDSAYDVTGVGDDVGAAQRTIDLVLKTSALLDRIKLPSNAECIDFGGGLGLFTRLMRDRGFNFFSYDLYATPFYSDRHSLKSIKGRSPAVVTAFEVLEHFANPAEDLKQLFEPRAALVIATTELFTGQDLSWPYLAEGTGQHIFFYSRQALNRIAHRFGYLPALVGGLIVFIRKSQLERLGISSLHAAEELRTLARGDLLIRHGLSLFVQHQQAPYEHILREVEAAAPRTADPHGTGE
jgi:2-polyprenyl-3-methyl-5-hydroxy-6-metoxy-1,4-benzoquinol methylase